MANINLKHLRYFWAVARAGSIARASEQLHVTPQSISSQLAELEHALGAVLLRRVGRGLELTDIGRRVAGHAEDIFNIEDELLATVREQSPAVAHPFRIGIADSVPKSLAYRVVRPALDLEEPLHLHCREGRLVSLLADLSVRRLDMVVADRPMPADLKVRAYSHLLGSSDLTVFGTQALVKGLKGAFPSCLNGAPFLLPGAEVAVRPALDQWFESQRIHPRIIGEFDDSALLKAFGQGGAGLFPAPTAIADYVCRQYDVVRAGRIEPVVEQLYSITTERRIQHPAALAISQGAARDVFAAPVPDRANRATGRAAAVPKGKSRQAAAKAR